MIMMLRIMKSTREKSLRIDLSLYHKQVILNATSSKCIGYIRY